ncbi:methylated-DNA--[protein]-cysteine S-methyltransferase [Phytoactinopolyspora mesophila]|uniref:Methylated-DNA--protein-cysteine methyltransferase n=1 Tax=Phytoactinopolyspora mesophila TaxID=2650750 RepID=A0A7K3M6L8_9ACTN|nr:methylated-DNA--[protein]-cysteine S-methyltransferase [Phytoactinopolyspora mesophila]NDL58687.1 methylated-DNA--[protein]-cysteine S-methyltransferase [Phytoactinopolyspora mesophila]
MDPQDDAAVTGIDTPVGRVSVAVTHSGLVDVSWAEPQVLAARLSLPAVVDELRTDPVAGQLAEYFAGTRRQFDLAIDWRHLSGTRRSLLQTLYNTVPYGASVTYGELAARHGEDVPARAVGGIMGSNPIPLVVPCHRVVAHDGLGGYSGGAGDGLEVKRWLLTHEGVLPPTLY